MVRTYCSGRYQSYHGYIYHFFSFFLSFSIEVVKEESFGPIVAIQSVASEQEAVKMMNDTKYGLTAGVYTSSKERAEKLMTQLNAGTVYWNACDRVSPFLPWSGMIYLYSGYMIDPIRAKRIRNWIYAWNRRNTIIY